MGNLWKACLLCGIIQGLFIGNTFATMEDISLEELSGVISYNTLFALDLRWLFSDESGNSDILVLKLSNVSLISPIGYCYGQLSLPELAPTCNPPFPCIIYTKVSSNCDFDALRYNLTATGNCGQQNAFFSSDELPRSITFDAILDWRKTFNIEYNFIACATAKSTTTQPTTKSRVTNGTQEAAITLQQNATFQMHTVTEKGGNTIAQDVRIEQVSTTASETNETTEEKYILQNITTPQAINATAEGIESAISITNFAIIIAFVGAILIIALVVIICMCRKMRSRRSASLTTPSQIESAKPDGPSGEVEMMENPAEVLTTTMHAAPIKIIASSGNANQGSSDVGMDDVSLQE
ncbi:uncharacterized protein LOC144430689 [Styela clava]